MKPPNRRFTDYSLAAFRFSIGGHALMAWYNSTKDYQSMLGRATREFNGLGFIVLLMAFFGACIVVDVLINDVMPAKYRWPKALKHRHLLLSILGICYVAQPFVGAMSNKYYPLTEYCIWNALIIYLASFLDAKKRSRELEWALHHK